MNFYKSLGLLALTGIAIGTVGCSSDPTTDDIATSDGTRYYLKVNINDVNSQTRAIANDATNFQNGTEAENAIGDLRLFFYDVNGKRIDHSEVTDYEFVDASTAQGAPNVGQTTVKTAIISVSTEAGSNLPSYLVVVANPINYEEMLGTQGNMFDLRNITRDDYKNSSGKFTMTNSSFYGSDPVSGATNVKITGAPISVGQLFKTEQEAKDAADGSQVDVYIERLAAKVNFTLDPSTINDYTIGEYTISFVPEAWGISADAAKEYGIKRFSLSESSDSQIPSFSDVQNYLGDSWTDWNDSELHRSFWACSPGFYAKDFPLVSDNIMDKVTNGTGAGQVVAPYALKYYSYNQLKNANGTAVPAGTTAATTSRYALENTMGKDAFASTNPFAAAPSVILVGKYTIKYNGTALPAGTTFYTYDNRIYFDDAVPTGAAANASTLLNKFLSNQSIIAIDNNGTLLNATNYGTVKDYVTLSVNHPGATIRGTQALDENFVTLQISNAGSNVLYYKPTGSSQWMPITAAALENVNRSLAGQVRYAHAYTNGAAYFSIPIQHLRASEDKTNSPFTNDNGRTVIDWTKVRPGDFGLVRNHVYDINVTGINGLGSGVLNPDAPIVSPMQTYNYWIRYTINILAWRIVPKQNVVL